MNSLLLGYKNLCAEGREMRQWPYCQELLSSLKRRVENIWPDVWWEPKGIIGCAGGGGQGNQFRVKG